MGEFGDLWGNVRSLVAYGLGPALGLLSGPILARALGPTGRGEFASIMQPMTVATGLACMGVPTALTYFIASGRSPTASLQKSLVLVTPAALTTYLAMAAYAAHLSKNSGVPLKFYLLAWTMILIGAYIQVLRAFWQGLGEWRRLDMERLLASGLGFITLLTLAIAGVSNPSQFAAYNLAAIVCASLVLIRLPRGNSSTAAPTWGALSRYSVSAWASLVFLYAGSRLDQALMPVASSTTQLGYYAVAVTVAEVPLVAAALVARDALHTASTGAPVRRVLAHGLPYWIAVVATSLAAAATASWFVPVVFGNPFENSAAAVQILCLSAVATTVIVFCVSVLSGYAHPRLSAAGPAASITVTLACFAWLWGDVSSLSAAWISASAQTVGAIVSVVLVARVSGRRAAITVDGGSR